MTRPLARQVADVIAYAKRWGIGVRLESAHDAFPANASIDRIPDIYWSPQRGAIDWSTRTIYFGASLDFDKTDPIALLHELSHCIGDQRPSAIDEPNSYMLAFEWFSCRALRLTGWSDWMRDYGVSDGMEHRHWDEVTTAVRGRLIQASLQRAVDEGLLMPDGKPTFRWSRSRLGGNG